jgi:ABC-type transport system substrate-binding protein
MPEVSADFRTFTFRIRPGIHFDNDPAFKGQKRELIAADYVYSIKRHYDPRWKSGNLYTLENAKILGLSELRKRLIEQKKPFDYDTEVEGLRSLDRYTFQIKLGETDPRFLYNLVSGSFLGALAREVVEYYGDKIGEHPVGTGPYRLAQWTRSSRIVLERNPNYRDEFYAETAPAGDARLHAVAARLKGRKLPMIDRVEVAIIEEQQPRWLSFLNQEHDLMEQVPNDFAHVAMPNNQLAPNLRKLGIGMVRYPRADVAMSIRWSAATNPARWRCGARSRWPSISSAKSASCGAIRPFPPKARSGRRPMATTRHSSPKWALTICRAPRPCSTCTATSIATATAGATSPTASR